jgi:hypothetical protein
MASRYRAVLAAMAIALFFTNLTNYLYRGLGLPVQPYMWIVALGLFLAPLALQALVKDGLRLPPLAIWGYVYAAISLLWFFGTGATDGTVEELETRLLSIVFMLLMLLLFSTTAAQAVAQRTLVVAVLFGVAVNLYELFNPQTFSEVLGRSAGLYFNPNQSGNALVLGMILALGAVRPHWRPLFMLVVGLGVTITFSRSAMLAWGIAFAFLCAADVLQHRRVRWLVEIGVVAAAAALFFVSPAWAGVQTRLQDEQVLNADVLGRVSSFSVGQFGDDSANERANVAEMALDQFNIRPILGFGTGAATEPPFDVGPHNIYLAQMVDHGIIGLFVFPVLVAACVWGVAPPDRILALTFAVTVLVLGLFSHNLLADRYALIAYALMAAITAAGRRRFLHSGEAR